MQLLLVKHNGALYPCDDTEIAEFDKLKRGVTYVCKVESDRTGQNHKRFFSLMRYVYRHQDLYQSFEPFRKEVIMMTGRKVPHVHVDLSVSFTAESIKYDKMDETEFSQLLSDAINVCLEHFCKNMTQEQLWEVCSYG